MAESAVGCRWQSQIKTGDHHRWAETAFHRQVSVRNFFEIHPGLGGILDCGDHHRISSDLTATASTCSHIHGRPHPRPQICSGQLVVRSHSDLARVVGVDPAGIPFDPRWTSDSIHLSRSEDRMNCAKSRIKKFFWSLLGSASSRDFIHRSDLHPVSDLAGQIRDTSQNTRVVDLSFRFEPR